MGCGWRAWERGPLARWWFRVVFARAAGGLEWYLRAISGLRAFAGRRPALLVERYGLAVLGCAWRVWERGPLARWWFGVVFVSYWWFEGFCGPAARAPSSEAWVGCLGVCLASLGARAAGPQTKLQITIEPKRPKGLNTRSAHHDWKYTNSVPLVLRLREIKRAHLSQLSAALRHPETLA